MFLYNVSDLKHNWMGKIDLLQREFKKPNNILHNYLLFFVA